MPFVDRLQCNVVAQTAFITRWLCTGFHCQLQCNVVAAIRCIPRGGSVLYSTVNCNAMWSPRLNTSHVVVQVFVVLLMLLLGLTGMSYGLLISSLASTEVDAMHIALGTFFPSMCVDLLRALFKSITNPDLKFVCNSRMYLASFYFSSPNLT